MLRDVVDRSGSGAKTTGELACPWSVFLRIRRSDCVATEGAVVDATANEVGFLGGNAEPDVAVIGGITLGQRHRLHAQIGEELPQCGSGVQLHRGAGEAS